MGLIAVFVILHYQTALSCFLIIANFIKRAAKLRAKVGALLAQGLPLPCAQSHVVCRRAFRKLLTNASNLCHFYLV